MTTQEKIEKMLKKSEVILNAGKDTKLTRQESGRLGGIKSRDLGLGIFSKESREKAGLTKSLNMKGKPNNLHIERKLKCPICGNLFTTRSGNKIVCDDQKCKEIWSYLPKYRKLEIKDMVYKNLNVEDKHYIKTSLDDAKSEYNNHLSKISKYVKDEVQEVVPSMNICTICGKEFVSSKKFTVKCDDPKCYYIWNKKLPKEIRKNILDNKKDFNKRREIYLEYAEKLNKPK